MNEESGVFGLDMWHELIMYSLFYPIMEVV